MSQTTARIKKGNKNFEILVDLDEAMKVRRGDVGANLNAAVVTENIFHNCKSGDLAGANDLEIAFGTSDPMEVSEKIIKEGEVVRTTESMKSEQDQKYKQVVDFLVRNAVSPEGRPYTPDRIMKALSEAHVNVKNKPIESQITDIADQLSRVLPLKIDVKKVKLLVPAQYTGKAYGAIKEFMTSEDWKGNGDLEAIVEVPAGLIFDFYDTIGNLSHGSILSEDIKD